MNLNQTAVLRLIILNTNKKHPTKYTKKNMQPHCLTEASKACFNTCCLNPSGTLSASSSNKNNNPCHDFLVSILSSIQPNSAFTNHESLPPSPQLLSALTNSVPYYLDTALVDHIRLQEYHHLSNSVCLDYIGHGLFSGSQAPSFTPFFEISPSSASLKSHLLGETPESEFQSGIRKRVTKHMNLLEEDYSVVFAANQASAFGVLAESYPFQQDKGLLTMYDHEDEAVRVMVESATRRGAWVRSAGFSWPDFRVDSGKLRKLVVNKKKVKKSRGMFVFPLQSRLTGSRYSYQWMSLARENGWHVLLDASAIGVKDMETLGLSLFQPDFLVCSFFKVVGESPSGFCCLFVRKSCVADLSRSNTSMGIISLKRATGGENQTVVFSGSNVIPSEIVEEPDDTETSEIECRALDHADKLGLILIGRRLRCLINWVVNALLTLRHPHSGNGHPLVRIYGPGIGLDRGPALALNVYDWKGERVNPGLVQKLADRNKISLSVGFLKNICFSDEFQEALEENTEVRKKGKQDGGVRVVSISLGMLSSFEDVYRMWGFVARFLDADFVEKERWRYTALNQTTVEL